MIRCAAALLLCSLLLPAAEVISFPSKTLTLRGVLYRPEGTGPFPAIVYNHGSAIDNSADSDALGPLFASHGWVFFMPSRRGQGLSTSAGPYIRDEIAESFKRGGISAAATDAVRNICFSLPSTRIAKQFDRTLLVAARTNLEVHALLRLQMSQDTKQVFRRGVAVWSIWR